MISRKYLILVIIFSVLIGFVIFKLNTSKIAKTEANNEVAKNINIPSLDSALPPINENSDLKREIDNLTPPSYKDDFEKLREDINN